MGNQGSQLGDEPVPNEVAQRNLQHFDHTFKGTFHTSSGPVYVSVFGEFSFQKKECKLTCKGSSFEIVEDVGISSTKRVEVPYGSVTAVSWDHANSEVKLVSGKQDDESFCIIGLQNSVEVEQELKLRFSNQRGLRPPSTMYVGMFAGSTKPKPFQRKRPNLTRLPAGKLPPLHDMRNMALDLHKGSYCPCPPGESRRMELAFQHIMEGFNTFRVISVKGNVHEGSRDKLLYITDEKIVYKPTGAYGTSVDFAYEDIADWSIIDNDTTKNNASGFEIRSPQGDSVYFGVPYIRDLKHTLEYFWNKYCIANGLPVMPGSTHGRPLVSVTTLSGEVPAADAPVGSAEVIDMDGIVVRPGGRIAARRASLAEQSVAAVTGSKVEPRLVPPENVTVKRHWHKVVMHQGWLLKKGGLGVGAAKNWLKRYVVLYQTSQGHFLAYYSDFTDCPMYTAEKTERNVIDLAKATFIRPGSNKIDQPDTPAHAFDIVTTEREWTLAAESQESEMKWLKLLTRAIDEDVAILPDEDLIFKVKPKVDPMGVLPSTEYSTSLKVSANGVAVCCPDNVTGLEKQHYFWVYTDFYKWSLLSQQGKLALLVNVFADSSFSRRHEFIFRSKDALRLSTAIEFFIEKFMSVMHVRLEATEGGGESAAGAPESGGMIQAKAEEFVLDTAQELDLLNLLDGPDVANTAAPAASSSAVDPFGLSDPFGAPPAKTSPAPAPATAPKPAANKSAGLDMDLLGGPSAPSKPAAAAADPFGADPFAAPAPTKPSAASKPSTSSGAVDLFGDDPFGAPAAPASAATPKTAPPLTAQQLQQHKMWQFNAMTNGGGPIYDDGVVQIASKIEVRGSQCRLSLFYRNQGTSTCNKLAIAVEDKVGLLRFEAPKVSSDTLGASAQGQLVIMMECMKPAAPGPSCTISYTDSALGERSNTFALPVAVTTFNEPIATLNGDQFQTRWSSLTGASVQPGQEMQEVLKPKQPIKPAEIAHAFGSTLKFHRVSGLPDASEFILYGAASLRTGTLAANGDKVTIGCLAKLEMNVQANALRVTVRTVHPAATSAIMQTAKTLLL